MGKAFISILVSVLLHFAVLCPPAVADKDKEEDPKKDPEGEVPAVMMEKDKRELARTAFVLKGSDGQEWLYVRLTSNQYQSSKVKTKTSLKKQGVIKIVLTPRQQLAIRHALNLDKPVGKIIMQISAKRLQHSSGLKGTYVVRSAPQFKTWLAKSQDVEETEEPSVHPERTFVENLKDDQLPSVK